MLQLDVCAWAESAYGLATAFFLAAHLAFISLDNFFFIAGLIGRRRVDFFVGDAALFPADLPFCFAHHAFFAAPILARAAALILRLRDAGCDDFAFGGRPRRAGSEPSPTRAAIARSMCSSSSLSCVTTLLMSTCILSSVATSVPAACCR